MFIAIEAKTAAFLIVNLAAICCCELYRESFNPSGAEYEGKSGQFNYAIFASVAVAHSRAVEMCATFYRDGRLAWLGDPSPNPIRIIIEQARALHAINFNSFFWIDGRRQWGKSCTTTQASCQWTSYASSFIERCAAESFSSVGVVAHEVRRLNATDSQDDAQLWPVLSFHFKQKAGSSNTYVISTAPGYVRAGFICAYTWDPNDCPVGYVKVSGLSIPKELVPTKVTTSDVCG